MEPLYQSKITCICCGSTFLTSRVRPSFKRPVRTDSDFCAYFDAVNPDFYVVRVCPYCGFASTENFNQHLNDKQKYAYLEKLGRQWKARNYGGARTLEEAMECYKLALLCAQAVNESDRVIAGLLHHIAWLYRYEEKKDQEDRFLQFALDAYVRVYEGERESLNNARLLYLIGELNRRLGKPREAVRWFSRVIHDKSITDSAMIRASREQWAAIREEFVQKGQELPEEMQSGA
ncbi:MULTISPECIES: DUF2225 domain-containing protein [Cohnella]|jgi:hypothetical protein|uniref:DUF2225 domain-containing protein n=1 Tax=Cohnella TaxID=329857 RepID=UPI00037B2B02|nr:MULTISPECIES: DUF2225 domain-containing protein [Cohnella]REK63661.1 MAG: DUF2225 domain-containing protein [Cohnella sp.]